MTALLGDKGFHYGRVGLAVVALGMGLHLVSGTLNQAALARGRARQAAVCWLTAAALFVLFVAPPTISAEVTRVEVGYFLAALVLAGLLYIVYRLGPAGSAWSKPTRSAGANGQTAAAAGGAGRGAGGAGAAAAAGAPGAADEPVPAGVGPEGSPGSSEA